MHIHLDGVRAELAKLGRFMELSSEHLAAVLTAHDLADPSRKGLALALGTASARVAVLEDALKRAPQAVDELVKLKATIADARASLQKAAGDRDTAKAALAAAQSAAAKAAAVAEATIAALRAHIAAIEAGAAAFKPIPAAPAGVVVGAADPDVTPVVGEAVSEPQAEQQVKSDT